MQQPYWIVYALPTSFFLSDIFKMKLLIVDNFSLTLLGLGVGGWGGADHWERPFWPPGKFKKSVNLFDFDFICCILLQKN